MRIRSLPAVAAVLLLGLGACGPATRSAAVTVARAGHGRAWLADAAGRTLYLRGVAVTGLIDYAPDYAENPPLTPDDLDEIAALGFDFIRLPVSWSLLEPRRGAFSTSYASRIEAVARAAWKRGLYTLVDMHFDRYARGLAPRDEADGAPAWAVITPASPCVGARTSDVCVRDAWNAFWRDARGVQRRYVDALVWLSHRLRRVRGIAGLELMNNPSTGATPSPRFEHDELWPFWRRAVGALRDAGERRPLWLDPNAASETVDAASLPSGSISSDSGLVYAPHAYTGVFSAPVWPAGGPARLAQWYAAASRDAAARRMALAVGEWGAPGGASYDAWIGSQLDLQDQSLAGSAFWMWKQRPGFYDWPVVHLDGSLRGDSERAQLLSRPHPDAVPGRLDGLRFDGSRLSLDVSGPGGTAELWSGTAVLSGGTSPPGLPLTRATIDGRAVPAVLSAREWSGAGTSLRGYVVRVAVPRGRHTVALSSGGA